MYFVYIIECNDHSLYTGITTNIARRLGEHTRRAGAKYTRAKGVRALVFVERKRTRSTASVREAQIKKLPRAKKLLLISTQANLRKKTVRRSIS